MWKINLVICLIEACAGRLAECFWLYSGHSTICVYVLIINICRIGSEFYSFRSVIGYFIWNFCLKIFQGR